MLCKVAHVAGEFDLSLGVQLGSDAFPPSEHRLSGFGELLVRGVMDHACRAQLLCDAVDSCAQRIRPSTAARAVSRIALSPLALSAHRTRSGVGRDALGPHETREVLAPFTQHGLVDMKAPSVGAFR